MRSSILLSFALLSMLLCNVVAGRLTLQACKQMCIRQSSCGLPRKRRTSRTAMKSRLRTGSVRAGEACSSDSDCAPGYGCAASKTCNKIVKDVSYWVFANDKSQVFINGEYQGFVPTGFDVVEFKYSGTCDDIIMKVINTGDYISASIAMNYGGWNHGSQGFHQPPNGVALPIYGRARLSPEGNYTNNDPSYDYMGWKEAIWAEDMEKTGNFPQEMKDAGADPVTSDDVGTPDNTEMGIRFEFPDCYT